MTEAPKKYTVGEVFVPGGLPTVTYVPRSSLGLEAIVRDYLDERHRILSLSGPTKSGKTVLLRSILADRPHIWLSGGEIPSVDDFWSTLADSLGISTEEVATSTAGGRESTGGNVRGGFSLGAISLTGGVSGNSESSTEAGEARRRVRNVPAAVRERLRTSLPPLVIDDFHYINTDVQLAIVRGLKDLIFGGVPVIVASVPHRAYDPVRVEREMTGRVEMLPIAFWSQEELVDIADEGFHALGVTDPDDLRLRLAAESFQSPHLMQDFCLQLCKANGVKETVAGMVLTAPIWEDFFRSRASAASKTAFDLLARGPRQRADRIERELKTGQVTDIYGVVLAAIAATGPLTQLTYEELRGSLRDVMRSEPPQRHEVTRVLDELSKIARDSIEGEPVVDYDTELATLFISDPFFAYYLRWAARPT
jgi:hypothetical protein